MKLALDSHTAITILRGKNIKVSERYIAYDPERLLFASIVAGELMVGALKSVRPNTLTELEEFLARHPILPFGEPEMREYARIRARLETAGMKIGPNDLLVAATALVRGRPW